MKNFNPEICITPTQTNNGGNQEDRRYALQNGAASYT